MQQNAICTPHTIIICTPWGRWADWQGLSDSDAGLPEHKLVKTLAICKTEQSLVKILLIPRQVDVLDLVADGAEQTFLLNSDLKLFLFPCLSALPTPFYSRKILKITLPDVDWLTVLAAVALSYVPSLI
jgi:hypothetical protein